MQNRKNQLNVLIQIRKSQNFIRLVNYFYLHFPLWFVVLQFEEIHFRVVFYYELSRIIIIKTEKIILQTVKFIRNLLR